MKKVRKPAPISAPIAVEPSGSRSIASGRTSKSATATTIPPLSAITVGSEWAMRSATSPPVMVVSTANAVSGIAISWPSTRSVLGAAKALAMDHEVVPGHRVLQVPREPLELLLEPIVLETSDPAATVADGVMVMFAARGNRFEAVTAIAESDTLDQPELMQQV